MSDRFQKSRIPIFTIPKSRKSYGREDKEDGDTGNTKRYAFQANAVEHFFLVKSNTNANPIGNKKQTGFIVKKL